MLKHPSLPIIERATLHLKVQDDRGPNTLANECLALGYVATSLIMDPGEFSSRGDIFDLYPVNGKPVRIEFFGDVIESIRIIDIENQRSVGTVNEISAIPRSTLTLTPENRQKLLERLTQQLAKQKEHLTELEFEGLEITLQNQCQALDPDQKLSFWPDGIDYYAPLTTDTPEQDFQPLAASFNLPNTRPILIVDDWAMLENNLGALSDRLERQAKEGVEKGRLLNLGFTYHLQDKAALTQLKQVLPNRLFLDTYPMTVGE